MFSRSSNIRISYMNPTEIYSVNSYLSFYLTKSQSSCFSWISRSQAPSWEMPGRPLPSSIFDWLLRPLGWVCLPEGWCSPTLDPGEPWPFTLAPFQVALQYENRKLWSQSPGFLSWLYHLSTLRLESVPSPLYTGHTQAPIVCATKTYCHTAGHIM